eukprot:4388631-Pleurochrysis_carterae.AAC.2
MTLTRARRKVLLIRRLGRGTEWNRGRTADTAHTFNTPRFDVCTHASARTRLHLHKIEKASVSDYWSRSQSQLTCGRGGSMSSRPPP